MRSTLLMIMLCIGCNGTAPKGDADSATIPDANAADLAMSADGSAGADLSRHDGSVNSTNTPDLTTVDDGPPRVSTEYREPEAIRGSACTDPMLATEACGGDFAAAVYCSLDDPNQVVMAICSSSSRGNQCDAMDDCGAGWSACTATDYVERGGRDVQPNFSVTNRAWLAACVQDAGGQTLRNEPCSPCTDFDPAYDPAVMWWCEDGSVVSAGGMDGDRLGVVTSPECFRVGQNTPNNGAWWALDFAGSGPSFVVCCDDAF